MTVPEPEPRIARFERLAYGMFIHWGLYSQLGKGEWIQHQAQIPQAEYEKLTETFTADEFDARAIARLAKDAGMKYITITSRHHDGFSLYDTRGLSDYDAPHSAAKRDLIAEFVDGCRAEGIIPFFYHTTLDWRWKTQTLDDVEFDKYLDYLHASVEILCTQYGPIGGLWFDGNWSRKVDWKEDRLYGIIRRHQPEAMIINNTGLGARGVVGHPEIDSTTFEQGLPTPVDRRGWPKYVAGEMCHTMNRHWGYAKDDINFISPAQVVESLALCRKVGANYLLNVGPTPEGAIPDYEAAALRRAGAWVKMQGQVIYEGQPATYRAPGRDFLLEHADQLYWFVFDLAVRGDAHVVMPGSGTGPRTITGLKRPIRQVRWLDNSESLDFVQHTGKGFATVDLTGQPYGTNWVVRVAEISL
jgi:alpha-L-fucosidase